MFNMRRSTSFSSGPLSDSLMSYFPRYQPPVSEDRDLADTRSKAFESEDKEMFLHVGHFTVWYGSAEFTLTLLIHAFSGNIHPRQFHALTKGMDGKVKVERLKKLVQVAGWEISKPLTKRIDHFLNVLVPTRNLLMHSHMYWPEGGNLQLTSIGAPPVLDGEMLGDPPTVISGLELFEKGTWLSLFAHDLTLALREVQARKPNQQTLGAGTLHSPLPTAHHPKTGPKASPAKKHMRVQKQ